MAAFAGLHLDEWQRFVLERSLGRRGGQWAAFEVGLTVSRQNGKGSIFEVRELGGLFVLDERLLVHSAHQFDTSLEAFRRLLALVEARDEFTRRVKKVSRSHGEEGIELYGPAGRRVSGGQRIRFRTRTRGGGRGFSADFLGLDEDMILPEPTIGALLPTLSARPDPQVMYAGSAVDQIVHEHGLVKARIRERGLRGDDPSLAYFEWSIDADTPGDVDAATAADPASWAQANPSLGIRITETYVANEQRSMDARTFAVERLGVGDWPNPDGEPSVIDLERWLSLTDHASAIGDPVCFAFDVPPDRSSASIGVAGTRPDGLPHIEVIEARRGTGWVVARLAELHSAHKSIGLVCDGASPAASLIPELEQLKLEVTPVSAKEHAQGCGMLYDGVEQARIRHLGQTELTAAVKGATKRTLGDAWAWSRKNSGVDISPLVASTLALWGLQTRLGQPAKGTVRAISLGDL